MAVIKRFVASRGDFQAAVVATIGLLSIAGIIDWSQGVRDAIDIALGLWLVWASRMVLGGDLARIADHTDAEVDRAVRRTIAAGAGSATQSASPASRTRWQ